MSWREQAACIGQGLAIFYPNDGQGHLPVEALRICIGCPVRQQCLDDILTNASSSEDGGVWGGTTEGARRDLRHGRATRTEILARGDRTATLRTHVEEEPWLYPSEAA